MPTPTRQTIEVDLPVRTVYNQWTQFEEFPRFMDGVREVHQLDARHLHWIAQVAGAEREWDAEIVDQRPDERIAWRAVRGALNTGVVTFEPAGEGRTRVTLDLDFEPDGLVEQAGDSLGLVERRVRRDLARFKEYIESRGAETGAWRGEINPDG